MNVTKLKKNDVLTMNSQTIIFLALLDKTEISRVHLGEIKRHLIPG